MRRQFFCILSAAVALALSAAPTPVLTNEIALDTVLDASPVSSDETTLDTTSQRTYWWTIGKSFSTLSPGLLIIVK